MTDQQHLDADVKALNDALTAISTEIDSLKAQPADAPLDWSGLDAAVASAQGLVPTPAPSPEPVPAPPEPEPSSEPATE